MAIAAVILFALTILGGAYLITYVLEGKNTPKGVAILHGAVGSLALITLLIAGFYFHVLLKVLIIFIAVAIGGIFLAYYDLTGKKIPQILALGHGAMAIIGFIMLLLVVFK
ncbi:hypothetical protein [Legionella sp. km772]|uniref:hypothetical protein n=1 Tax=Legionella sp. km772 TaxID=2498111 RepID=UPI000F8E9119|nr:hypothetical protein [Legionella sp. km772]RUR07520.1 hypothetical protein ELY15_12090 [Legionella sp. km772]